MTSFRDTIKDQLILIDGAMGTYIYQKGVFIDKCYDALNLSNPDLIESIHREYVEAGACVIETNTYGANRFKLARHSLSDRLAEINMQGVRIARKAAENAVYVAGSIGPLGVEIAPFGGISRKEARDAFAEQSKPLLEEGVDLLILETFRNLDEIEQAVLAIRSLAALPILAHMAVLEDGTTEYGSTVEETIRRLSGLEVDAVGLNCAVGPKSMLDFLERTVCLTGKPISIMPNAGRPHSHDGRTFYMSTPEYFGVYTKRLIEAGARILGGCCGTTPVHIRKMADALAQKETRTRIRPESSITLHEEKAALPEPVPFPEKSRLADKLFRKEFVTLVEMVPPRSRELEKHLSGARLLQENRIDAINIPDGPRASARLNGLALAVRLQTEIGIETVLHYTCRDRNLLGMQSDLLGASALGINNVLAITGDPPMMGDYPAATAVFDIDSIGLTQLLSRLNRGLDIGRRPVGAPTGFLIGVGVDPNSVNVEREVARFRQKVEAGAEFAITQPVFDFAVLEGFLEKILDFAPPVLAGVWPLVSLRNAEFMKNEVPGVVVPDSLLKRIGRFDTREDQLKAGVEIAREMAAHVRKRTQGIQVSAPFGRYGTALDVMQGH
ncbi:MAG TPA: bifunctional homocysteine S-methyltransferase/methylenetetrahydrofolate reductase [bacterium]|nr:bifunctional homocysteine S-methyltransferase/methylenetetrahydrofolate reductase [bacterium]